MIISKGDKQSYPELRGELKGMRYPAYVEPKIDGELNWFCGSHLINKSGKQRYECKVTQELMGMMVHKHRLLGELHWGDGKSGDLYEFLKHQTDDELRFTVFDVDMPGTYEERRAWLEAYVQPTPPMKHVQLVEVQPAKDKKMVDLLYKSFVDEGYEGIVVKSADSRLIMGPCPWVKLKHREMTECMIVQIDPILERMDVQVGKRNVGVKIPNGPKQLLKAGDVVEIEHQGILSQGGLRHPVFIRRIGEKT